MAILKNVSAVKPTIPNLTNIQRVSTSSTRLSQAVPIAVKPTVSAIPSGATLKALQSANPVISSSYAQPSTATLKALGTVTPAALRPAVDAMNAILADTAKIPTPGRMTPGQLQPSDAAYQAAAALGTPDVSSMAAPLLATPGRFAPPETAASATAAAAADTEAPAVSYALPGALPGEADKGPAAEETTEVRNAYTPEEMGAVDSDESAPKSAIPDLTNIQRVGKLPTSTTLALVKKETPTLWQRFLSFLGFKPKATFSYERPLLLPTKRPMRRSGPFSAHHARIGADPNPGIVKAQCESIVRRVRAGDQNAMAIMALVRDNAAKGESKAKASLEYMKRYALANPVKGAR